MSYVITLAILAAAAVLLRSGDYCKRLSRLLADYDRDEQFRRDHQAGIAGGGRDRLEALIEATRELPHESYAWGPGAGQPNPCELGDFALWQAEMEDQR